MNHFLTGWMWNREKKSKHKDHGAKYRETRSLKIVSQFTVSSIISREDDYSYMNQPLS